MPSSADRTTEQTRDSSTRKPIGLKDAQEFLKRHRGIKEENNLLEEILNHLSQALEMDEANTEMMATLAECYWRMADSAHAERLASKILDRSEKHPVANWIMAEMAFQKGQGHAARKLMRRVHFPKIADMALLKARLSFQQWRNNRSLKAAGYLWQFGLEGAWAIHRMTAELFSELGWKECGFLLKESLKILRLLFKKSSPDTVIETLMRLSYRYPGEPELMLWLSSWLCESHRFQEAVLWAEKALQRDPTCWAALKELMLIYEAWGKPEQSLSYGQQLLEYKPTDPEAHCQMGNLYYALQRYEEATTAFQTALMLSPKKSWKAMVAQTLADLYHYHLNKPEQALLLVTMAKSLDERSLRQPWSQLGVLAYEQGSFSQAELASWQAIDQPLKEKSTTPDVTQQTVQAQAWSNLAYLYWMQYQEEKAVEAYQKAIDINPAHEVAYNNLAVILMETFAQTAQATEYLQKATELNPNYALAMYNLGRAYRYQGLTTQAANSFQKAMELNRTTLELDHELIHHQMKQLFEKG